MTHHCSNEYVQHLEFHQAQTSHSNVVIITESRIHSSNLLVLWKKKFQQLGWKSHRRNDNAKVERQFGFFMADNSEGLTQARMVSET